MHFLAAILLSVSFPCALWAHGGHQHPQETAHLSFFKSTYHAHIAWEKGPQVGIESQMRVEWYKGAEHLPIAAPGNFTVELWMPSMGHGSAPTLVQQIAVNGEQKHPGVYRVSQVYFVMPGEWIVTLTLTLPNGEMESQIFEVRFEGEGHSHHH